MSKFNWDSDLRIMAREQDFVQYHCTDCGVILLAMKPVESNTIPLCMNCYKNRRDKIDFTEDKNA